MIPKNYVMQWRKDMENRKLILKNAELADIPHGAHEDSLFWQHRERLCHGQERTGLLDTTVCSVPQHSQEPPIASYYSKYRSSLITRRGVC
ncbi:TEX43 protein, partial [Amia calva]|nr:TEX43 protein [Amia calva]